MPQPAAVEMGQTVYFDGTGITDAADNGKTDNAYGGTGEAGGSCCPLCPYPLRGPVVFRPPGGGSALYPGGGVRVVRGEGVPWAVLPEGKPMTIVSDDIENIEREKKMKSSMDGIYPETDLDAVKGNQPISH